MTVVVIVTDTDSVAPARVREPCFSSDISERTVSIVVIKVVGWLVPRRIAFQPCTAGDKDIHPAIVIIVVECDAGSVGLDDISLPLFLSVNCGSGEPRTQCDVRKIDRPGPSRKFGTRRGLDTTRRHSLPAQSCRA